MKKLSKGVEKIIEEHIGLSLNILKKIDHLSFTFYIQNRYKMSIEEFKGDVYFHIKERGLKKDVNNVLGKSWRERTRYFSPEEMEKYLQKIGYKELPLDTTPRIDGLPIMSRAERKGIFKKLLHI